MRRPEAARSCGGRPATRCRLAAAVFALGSAAAGSAAAQPPPPAAALSAPEAAPRDREDHAAAPHAASAAHGFLLVRTTGAEGRARPDLPVHIDGEAAGRSPLRRMLDVGRHHVDIARGTAQHQSQSVDIEPLRESAVRFDLAAPSSPGAADGATPASAKPTRSEPSVINWIIGGSLGVAGVVALISPLSTLANEGRCITEIEGTGCQERVQFGVQSGVLIGVGALLLLGAVLMDAWAPFRDEVPVEDLAQGILVRF